MTGRRHGSLSAIATVLFACAAAAGVPGLGCAHAGHGDSPSGLDEGGATVDGGVSAVVDASTAAPSAQGVALFSQSCSKGTPSVDWSPMRRISRIEYNNMVHDLLGDSTQPANGFPPESPMGDGINFQVNTYRGASATVVQQYLQAAETLAETAVADTNALNNNILNSIPSCGSAKDDTCARDFIGSWANRAYRGQLDATEASGLFDVYSSVKGTFDWATGIQAVITTVLESPRFLYVLEFGDGTASSGIMPLSQYEVAGRLALFLWRSVPDATLMNDAAQGNLGTAAQLQAEAQRMLTGANQSKAKAALDDFTNQWMELTGIQAKDSQFTTFNSNTNLPNELYEETRRDVSQLVLVDDGTLTDLLTSSSSYVNQDLATFYGTTVAGSQGQTFVKTSLPHRSGILTTGGVMATQAHSTLPSLVLRGKLVRENLLCDAIPPPPPNIPAAATTVPEAGTTRDLLLSHQQKGTICPSCHQYMDSIGTGFGIFDATGAYQPNDANGFPGDHPAIDSSGSVAAMGAGDLQTTFTDSADLTKQLAGADRVRQCFTLQELRYALGRVETSSDACSAQQIYAAFSPKFDIRQLLLAVVQSDAFRYRSAPPAGSACQ